MKSTIDFSQKGLFTIIVVVILAILGVGAFILYNSRSSQESTSKTTQINDQTKNGYHNYYNPLQGVKFVYPSDWQKTEFKEPTIIKALFVKDEVASFKFLTDDNNTLSKMRMDQYNQSVMEGLKNVPGFKLIEEKDVTINGIKYHQATYTANDEKNNTIKTIHLWTLTDKKGYGFSYNSLSDQFDTYLAQAKVIINSITLF